MGLGTVAGPGASADTVPSFRWAEAEAFAAAERSHRSSLRPLTVAENKTKMVRPSRLVIGLNSQFYVLITHAKWKVMRTFVKLKLPQR